MSFSNVRSALFLTLVFGFANVAGCGSAIEGLLATFVVGGTVSGLDGTLVLQNNDGDDLSITSDGAFMFATEIEEDETYEVTVLTQPEGQVCSITNATGTVTEEVTDVNVTCVAAMILFITNATTNGDIDAGSGGIVSADAFCNADANKPNASTYKALIVDGTNRVACTTSNCSGGSAEHVDWALQANTAYVRPDSTVIGTTDSDGLFTFPLTNTYLLAEGSNQAARTWTGLLSDWTADFACTAWTTTSGNGRHGRIDITTSQAIAYNHQLCIDSNFLACVEQ